MRAPRRAQALRIEKSERRRRVSNAAPSFALRVFGIPHLADRVRLIHQALQVVHKAVPAVLGILVVAPDVDRLFRANLLTVAAEDAAKLVDLEDERVAVSLFVFARHQLDAIRGTDSRTKSAGHAFRFSGFGGQHSVSAAPARRDRRFLLGILGGHPAVHVEEMLDRKRHSLERSPDIADVADRPLNNLHSDCHYLPASRAAVAVISRRRSSCRIRSSSLGCIRPYAGLMIRPRSRIANSMITSPRFMEPRIAAYKGPGSIPAAERPSITAAISTMYTSASGSMNFHPSDISCPYRNARQA